ncbi:MAG: hypothetical protein ABSG85_19135 [Spirochaetia bacterium]|jgi:hypothetical protein
MRKARSSGNWDPVLAGLTLFGMDFFNETGTAGCWRCPVYLAHQRASGEPQREVELGEDPRDEGCL